MTCHVCSDTDVETFDDTDNQGHLCTGSKPCTRCARRRLRRARMKNVGLGLVALLALILGLLPSAYVGLFR